MDPNGTVFFNFTLSTSNCTLTLVSFAICGVITMLVNVLIFLIAFSDRKLREKSALLIGVAGSNFLYGLGISAIGIFRLSASAASELVPRVMAWTCVQLIFPLFIPLACQTLSVMLCVAGIDRLLATATPNWYYTNWTWRRSWFAVLIAYAIAVLPLGWGLLEAWEMEDWVSYSCLLPLVFGSKFVAWFFGCTVIGGTAAVLLTLVAYYASMKRISKLSLLNGELGRLKRQLQLTRAMFTISSMDFVLVVIPTAIACYANATPGMVHPRTVQDACNIVYCINASVGILPHFVFNSKFREVAFKLFGTRTYCWCRRNNNKVAPPNVLGKKSAEAAQRGTS